MNVYIETDRLLIRDWEERDERIFQQMNADFTVRHYFPDLLSYQASKENIKKMQKIIDEQGIGLFAVELKATQKFIGMVGLNYVPKESNIGLSELPFYEIGWRLEKEVWGNGLATEAAEAILEFAKKKGIDEVYSFTSAINKPSIRVMEKLNMKFIKEFIHYKVKDDKRLYKHVLYYKSLKGED